MFWLFVYNILQMLVNFQCVYNILITNKVTSVFMMYFIHYILEYI